MGFAGWELPVWYTSILKEHKAVRTGAGIFDVSDMGRVCIKGAKAGTFLNRVLTKPVTRLGLGSAQLCLMCLENGGILDDLWVYKLGNECYYLVWNAANAKQKLDWLLRWSNSDPDIAIEDRSVDTAMVAIQGPKVTALKGMEGVANLPRFAHTETKFRDIKVFVARTGYTGEDGFEIIAHASDALTLWEYFTDQRVIPCGLGARDSLRLEAGMMLYGQDMDVSTNAFEAGLGWLINMGNGNFIGKSALLEIKRQDVKRKLVGFRMKGREIARSGYRIIKSGEEVGKVTSGGFAPTLGANIGFGYVTADLGTIDTEFDIMIRNKPVPAKIVNKKFYVRGGRK
jgi:aminomethyltransferase